MIARPLDLCCPRCGLEIAAAFPARRGARGRIGYGGERITPDDPATWDVDLDRCAYQCACRDELTGEALEAYDAEVLALARDAECEVLA